MKHLTLLVVFLIIAAYCRAQKDSVDVRQEFYHIIELIKNNKVNELARLIEYPLRRENPLPNILTAKQFIAYYPTMIDEAFQKKLGMLNDSNIFKHEGSYGLIGGGFNGDIWMDENGKVAAINYSSQKEQSLQNNLIESIQSKMYPTVNSWISNILVCRSKNLLIRIDETENGTRYASWSNGRTISEKPDLILYMGVAEGPEMQGGWVWTFNNGDWKYVVDDVEMAEKNRDLGYFLEILYKGALQSTERLEEIK